MLMNRQEKEVVVSDLTKLFTDYDSAFLVNYKGLSVATLQALRRNLRKEGEVFKVTKARLMKRAASDAGQSQAWVDELQGNFKNQIGLVFSSSDVSLIAKKLVGFAKEHEKMQIISALVKSKVLSLEEIRMIASLPPREQLLAMVLGTMKAPITSFAQVLNAMLVKLVVVLQEVAKQKEQVEQKDS